jgi:hypothetical protein
MGEDMDQSEQLADLREKLAAAEEKCKGEFAAGHQRGKLDQFAAGAARLDAATERAEKAELAAQEQRLLTETVRAGMQSLGRTLEDCRLDKHAVQVERDALAAQNARLRAALEDAKKDGVSLSTLAFNSAQLATGDMAIRESKHRKVFTGKIDKALALTPPAALEELRRRERIATLREAASIASHMEQEDDATAGAVWERLTHMADYQEQLTTDPRGAAMESE